MKIYRVAFSGGSEGYRYFSAASKAKQCVAAHIKDNGVGDADIEQRTIGNSKQAVISLLNDWASHSEHS